MSYNFKKINDLELVNAVSEGANVLIETDGATKRLPSTAINNGYTKEECDEKFLTLNNLPESVTSWNDLEDKPFYEETTVVNEPLNITWDGNTEGLVSIEDAPFYKISDLVLTEEQLKACTATIYNGPSLVVGDIWDDNLADGALIITDDVIYLDEVGVIVARKDGAIFSPVPDISVTIPESGIYFNKFNEDAYASSLTSTEPIEQVTTTVKKIDPKFLPDGLPYEETTVVNEPLNITWDGNTEGLVSAGDAYYKVSDLVLTDEQIKSTTVTTDEYSYSIGDKWDEMVFDGDVQDDAVSDANVIFVRKDGATAAYGTLFPECGIYFMNYVVGLTTTEPIEQVKTTVKKLDPKFLPDNIGGGGLFLVTVTMTENGPTCDATATEIQEAVNNGRAVSVRVVSDDPGDNGNIYQLCHIRVNGWNKLQADFSLIEIDGEYVAAKGLYITDDGVTNMDKFVLHENAAPQ